MFMYDLQGRLLSLLDDNTIHLWELVAAAPRDVGGVKKEGVVSLQEVGCYSLPGRPGIESCRYTRDSFKSYCYHSPHLHLLLITTHEH